MATSNLQEKVGNIICLCAQEEKKIHFGTTAKCALEITEVNNWLIQLCRMRRPKICRLSQRAGDSGEPTGWFQSEGPQAVEPERADGSV